MAQSNDRQVPRHVAALLVALVVSASALLLVTLDASDGTFDGPRATTGQLLGLATGPWAERLRALGGVDTLFESDDPPRADGRPVQFEPGADAGPGRTSTYVPSYALSPDGTSFSIAVRGVPEATLTIGSLVRLVHEGDGPRSVALGADPVTNPYVDAYTLQFIDGAGAVVGTLELTSAQPAAEFPILPGDVLDVRLALTLGSGAGRHNVDLHHQVELTVS